MALGRLCRSPPALLALALALLVSVSILPLDDLLSEVEEADDG